MDDPDSIDTRISSECPVGVQAILRAARRHDRAALKDLLDGPGKASCRDPVTGETPLHAAVRGAGARVQNGGDAAAAVPSDAARVVEQLLFGGAIWNDVDDQDETPGCVAWRLHQTELYEILVRAGTRAEMLFAVLDGYEALGSDGDEEDDEGDGEEDDEEDAEEEGAEGKDEADPTEHTADPTETEPAQPEQGQPAPEAYLDSHLTLADGKLVDAAGNGVMMEWETDIMRRSVDALLGPADVAAATADADADDEAAEKRVLNIGFGLGIIDSLLAARRPARHHIIEAHPDVLARIDRHSAAAPPSAAPAATSSDHAAEFGAAWEAAGRTPGAHRVWRGRWQDVCPRLLAEGELYDAIYFDTFGEDYAALRRFFVDYLPGLLADGGVFGFFNGLGADRRVCYDVYTHVVEMHLAEAGLDVAWQTVDVPLAAQKLDAAGQGAWAGIVRPYWTLDQYRLPICTFLG